MTWTKLDEQMSAWSARLVSEVKVSDADSRKLATIIASEVRFLPAVAKAEILDASPVRLGDRLQELQAFQGWMDIVRRSAPSAFASCSSNHAKLHFIRLPARSLFSYSLKTHAFWLMHEKMYEVS